MPRTRFTSTRYQMSPTARPRAAARRRVSWGETAFIAGWTIAAFLMAISGHIGRWPAG